MSLSQATSRKNCINRKTNIKNLFKVRLHLNVQHCMVLLLFVFNVVLDVLVKALFTYYLLTLPEKRNNVANQIYKYIKK